jgi:hypothetical protein
MEERRRGRKENRKTKNRRGGREEDRKTKGFHDENLPSTRYHERRKTKNSMETHIPMLTRNKKTVKSPMQHSRFRTISPHMVTNDLQNALAGYGVTFHALCLSTVV